jgi:hypothetical protein
MASVSYALIIFDGHFRFAQNWRRSCLQSWLLGEVHRSPLSWLCHFPAAFPGSRIFFKKCFVSCTAGCIVPSD